MRNVKETETIVVCDRCGFGVRGLHPNQDHANKQLDELGWTAYIDDEKNGAYELCSECAKALTEVMESFIKNETVLIMSTPLARRGVR